jgi:GntR family transcriptional regulator
MLSHEPPGTRAPSERQLAAEFGVTRMTVRQAVDALVVEGVLERVRGSGTFVARGRGDCQFTSYTEEMLRRGLRPGSRTLVLRRERPGAPVAAALEIAPTEDVVRWTRVRLADGIAMCVEDAHLPAALVVGLVDGDPPESLYVELGRRGHTPTRVEDAVESASCIEEEARLLGVAPGDPALVIARRTFSGPTPVEVSRSVYRSDRYALRYSLLRGGLG